MSRRFLLLCVVFLGWVLSTPVRAGEAAVFLSKGRPEVLSLLPNPPAAGSEEALAELSLVRQLVAAHTAADVKAVADEDRVTAFSYAPAIGDWFVPGKFPKVEALMAQVEADTAPVVREAKRFWNRPRPFMTDASIKPLAEEKSFSYPSGHGTRGMVYALVLAELFPAKREAILARGRAIGWHRVVAGVHYPSDIQSGRVLGLALYNEFMRSEAFRKALAEARAELQAPHTPMAEPVLAK